MKKRDLKNLALMGMASGLFISSQTGAAFADESSDNPVSGQMLAAATKHACKGKNGCPGLADSSNPSWDHSCSHGCGSLGNRGAPSWDHSCSHGCGSIADRNAPAWDHSCSHGCGSIADRDPTQTKLPIKNLDKNSGGNSNNSDSNSDPNDGNLGYHLMSEEELKLELNKDGIKLYESLSPAGKALALQVASTRCAATNVCSHLNACRSSNNNCAGQSACKGRGKCALSDKNLAVRLVYQKMKDKRSAANRE